MVKVKLTITQSRCRSGFHKQGQVYIIDENHTICPPICMELWSYAYPYIWALLNGATLDASDAKIKSCDILCPDENRVHMHIEVINKKDI